LWIADHIGTLQMEFNSIWKRKITGTSFLFLVNRYISLLYLILKALFDSPGYGTDMQCRVENIMFQVCETVALVATNVLFALRVYAIYNKNRVILGIALVFVLSRFVLDIWKIPPEFGASTIGSPFENSSRCGILVIQLAIPFLALGYDIFIFVLTAIKTIQHAMAMQRLGQSSITQDYIFFHPFYRLPNLLISRLMLNLRIYSEPGNSTISKTQHTHVSSLNFASNRILGNIGAPLDGGLFNEE
ncbi:hypothetical protein GG344DRAFT_26782, partial [Lentinula edodes]